MTAPVQPNRSPGCLVQRAGSRLVWDGGGIHRPDVPRSGASSRSTITGAWSARPGALARLPVDPGGLGPRRHPVGGAAPDRSASRGPGGTARPGSPSRLNTDRSSGQRSRTTSRSPRAISSASADRSAGGDVGGGRRTATDPTRRASVGAMFMSPQDHRAAGSRRVGDRVAQGGEPGQLVGVVRIVRGAAVGARTPRLSAGRRRSRSPLAPPSARPDRETRASPVSPRTTSSRPTFDRIATPFHWLMPWWATSYLLADSSESSSSANAASGSFVSCRHTTSGLSLVEPR